LAISRKWLKGYRQRTIAHVAAVLVALCDDEFDAVEVDLRALSASPRTAARVLAMFVEKGWITYKVFDNDRHGVAINHAGREQLRKIVWAAVSR
jgi:hypothetical protein